MDESAFLLWSFHAVYAPRLGAIWGEMERAGYPDIIGIWRTELHANFPRGSETLVEKPFH